MGETWVRGAFYKGRPENIAVVNDSPIFNRPAHSDIRAGLVKVIYKSLSPSDHHMVEMNGDLWLAWPRKNCKLDLYGPFRTGDIYHHADHYLYIVEES